VVEQLGGLYLDLAHDLAVGTDGIAVESLTRRGSDLEIKLKNLLALLPSSYEQPYPVKVNVSGARLGTYRLSLNGAPPRPLTATELTRLSILVGPGQSFQIASASPK
jgi:hypothetical protein